MSVRILVGDMAERLKDLPDASVDSCVCDPPYHLTAMTKPRPDLVRKADSTKTRAEQKAGINNPFASRQAKSRSNCGPKAGKCEGVNAKQYKRLATGFMGQTWDGGDVAFREETWAEVLRVLKPGAHLIAFSGTRTYHRMVCAIEDAGFEIRDQLAWVFGSGFPKSHDVSKQIDKRGGTEIGWFGPWLREERRKRGISSNQLAKHFPSRTGGETGCVRNWELGLNLPTNEQFNLLCGVLQLPFAQLEEVERAVVGEKQWTNSAAHFVPGEDHTQRVRLNDTAPATDAAKQWEGWGTALKPAWEPICLARKPLIGTVATNVLAHGTGALNIDGCRIHADDAQGGEYEVKRLKPGATLNKTGGNWRPEGDDAERFTGEMKPGRWPANIIHDGSDEVVDAFPDAPGQMATVTGNEPSSPFQNVYGDMPNRAGSAVPRGDSGSAARFFYCAKTTTEERGEGNNHPTVKPVALMRWLTRLVTPKGGTVLDPFMGSGSTLIAADMEQFNAIGCELSPEYAEIARRRIASAAGMFADVSVEHAANARAA